MATISSPGLGSGLDVNSIVTQLVAIERRPIDALQSKASTIQTQLSSFGLLQSYAANLRDISAQLAKPDFWTANAATSSDAGAVSATATATALKNTYAVGVSKLAQSQSLSSKAYTDGTSTVGTGTLHIQMGAWDDDLTTFDPDPLRSAVDITIGPGENTLEGIQARVNAANAGITASIVRDDSGAKLVFRSTATGATNAAQITVTDDDANPLDDLGLSALAFDPPTAGSMTQNVAAQNTVATINGLTVTSSTNVLTNVIDGVTLTVGRVTTTPAQIMVGPDTAAQKTAIANFAKAYSDMNTYISSQTKYDATTKKAGALQGDRATLTLQSNLRSIFLDNSTASFTFTRLSDIGLELQKDGSMTVNNAKLNAAAEQPAEVARLFSTTNLGNNAGQGFAVRVKALTEQMTRTDGVITSRSNSLRDSIKRNSLEQQRLEDRVAANEARLLKRYNALDTQINQIKGNSSSLSQALESLANLNKSIASGR